MNQNLVLIGGRGCGKSSVSRRLLQCNKRFQIMSLDTLIRYEAYGATIPEIVAEHGWPHFRELEFTAASKAGSFAGGALIDCGGGVVVDLDDNGDEVFSQRKVDALKAHGRVVYLKRPFDYLAKKIAGDTNRPDLSATRSFAEIMERRDPWYIEAADHVVECDEVSKWALVHRVLTWFYDDIGIKY